MKYNDLQVQPKVNKIRPGRGIAAGRGKTAGRGTKGQNARSGGSVRPGFEGGQNPLMQRIPKLRGFTSHRPKTYTVYTGQLNSLGAKVDNEVFAKSGLIPSAFVKVKIILKGEVTKKVTVSAQAISESAKAAIVAAGGTFTKSELPKRPRTADKSKKD